MGERDNSRRVIPLEQMLPRVRVALGHEEVTLRDGARVRAAVALLRALEAEPTADLQPERVRLLCGALRRFCRALLGDEASAEVVDGMAYVALLHLARTGMEEAAPCP